MERQAPGGLLPPLAALSVNSPSISHTLPTHMAFIHSSHTLGGSGATVSALLAPDTDTAVRDTVTCDIARDLCQAITHEERGKETLRGAPMRDANKVVL